MRNLSRLVFLVTMVAALPAIAADLPARVTRVAPSPGFAPAPVFTWSGFYAGGNLGGGWSNGSGTFTTAGIDIPVSGTGSAFLGGVQAGYNWQFSQIILGVETDFQGSTGRGDLNSTGAFAGVLNGTVRNPWFGTIRGRLGYAAWDRVMLYVTGGGLYGRTTYSGTLASVLPFSTSASFWTWTVGGGAEWAVWDRWSAKLEYLYAATPDKAPLPPFTTAASGNVNGHIVRVGLNYHF